MARNRLTDPLLTNRFHLLDVSFSIPPVFIPIFGFMGITTPELTYTYKNIKEGNYEYPRKVFEKADVGAVTLTQGSTLLNSDFWDWINKKTEGRSTKKNLLIVQFTNINPLNISDGGSSFSGLVEFDFRIPGKGWLLLNCEPGRYKPGSDFEAQGGQVSVQSLDIEFEEFIEFNCGIG